jgi:hypothetical protein
LLSARKLHAQIGASAIYRSDLRGPSRNDLRCLNGNRKKIPESGGGSEQALAEPDGSNGRAAGLPSAA